MWSPALGKAPLSVTVRFVCPLHCVYPGLDSDKTLGKTTADVFGKLSVTALSCFLALSRLSKKVSGDRASLQQRLQLLPVGMGEGLHHETAELSLITLRGPRFATSEETQHQETAAQARMGGKESNEVPQQPVIL